MDALLKDSEHLAAMIDNVSSVDNLDFIMESDALGHTVMDQTQGHETLVAVAGTVTLEEVGFAVPQFRFSCRMLREREQLISKFSVIIKTHIKSSITTGFLTLPAYHTISIFLFQSVAFLLF